MEMYQLSLICDTDVALNCDVAQNKQYLGRLYVFPTTNSDLIAMGVEKEWFLAHAEGEFVISGYVNTEGQWSLSPHRSLQLSDEYTTQEAIFERVFDSEYVRDVLASCNLEQSKAVTDVEVANNRSGNGDGDSGENQPTKFDSQLIVDWNGLIPQLDVLRELLVTEVEPEQEAFSDEKFEPEQPDELEAATFTMSVQTQLIPNEEFAETKRVKVQNALIETVLSEYEERKAIEFLLPPFGTVTVHAEDEYFVLCSDSDGQTILTATLDGEVMDELSLANAVKFDEVLQQSEIETARWLTDGDDQNIDNTLLEQERKQSKGMEYGD